MSDRPVSTIYVVYHAGYGGFHINADEYNWLAQHRPRALARIEPEDLRHIDSEGVAHPPFFGTWEGSRHDPDLVACVRALTPPMSMPRAERRLRSKNRVEEFQGAAGLMAYRVIEQNDGWESVTFLDLDNWAGLDSWEFSISDAGIPSKEIKYD